MQRNRKPAPGRARALIVLVVLLLALGGSLLSTAARHPNGAGLVIRHGDSTLIYAYVQFDEDSINGLDLITRSGIDATLAPFGGLGGAVCSLNGEGCSSDDCFCHSYASPAYYWNYYIHSGDGWSAYPVGPSSRTLTDGDVDGWSWTAAESGLPETNIDEIAQMNGFERSQPSPPATLEQMPPTATTTWTQVPQLTATSTAVATASPSATSRAVVVAPGATPAVLAASDSASSDGETGYLMFAGMLVLVVAVGAGAFIRNRFLTR
jgi:hypothetical protein